MVRDVAGRGLTGPSRPAPRRGPAQLPGNPAQQEERRQELQALRAKLDGERLHNQELRRHFAAEISKMKEAAKREQQLMVQQLQCEWEKQQALDIQRLQELQWQQRAAETRQLLRWKEAELLAAQEMLQQERDAALHQARELQRQLADELRRPCSSNRAAHAKLQDVLKELRWETHGDQPARIRYLQHELELEKRLFIKYIVAGFEGEQEDSQGTTGREDREGPWGKAQPKKPTQAPSSQNTPQQGAKESCSTEQGSSRHPVKDAHVQVRNQAEEAGRVEPGEDKAPGRPQGGLPVPKGGYRKAGERLFVRECSGGIRVTARSRKGQVWVRYKEEILPREGGEAPTQAGGAPSLGGAQGQAGRGWGRPGLGAGVVPMAGAGTRWALSSLPSQPFL